ncbi:MAG: hypothetical protein H7268_03310 [Sandarakinorhabdus sp.]|nr:hypothetical protein [Sandarakinorhabdus sp.]
MQFEALSGANAFAGFIERNRKQSSFKLDPAREPHRAIPAPAPPTPDAAAVQRLYADDPFFRARADRYAQLDDAIRSQETTLEGVTSARKYLEMLKKRRDAILLELIDLSTKNIPAVLDPLWRLPAAAPSIPSAASRNPKAPTWRWT